MYRDFNYFKLKNKVIKNKYQGNLDANEVPWRKWEQPLCMMNSFQIRFFPFSRWWKIDEEGTFSICNMHEWPFPKFLNIASATRSLTSRCESGSACSQTDCWALHNATSGVLHFKLLFLHFPQLLFHITSKLPRWKITSRVVPS